MNDIAGCELADHSSRTQGLKRRVKPGHHFLFSTEFSGCPGLRGDESPDARLFAESCKPDCFVHFGFLIHNKLQ